MKVTLSALTICFLLLLSGLLLHPSSTVSAQEPRVPAASQTVTIGANGFSPNALVVTGPTDVSFENRSGVTVTLRSGVPTNPGTQLYLPTVINSDGSRARTISRVRTGAVDFVVVLGPGDTFVQRYTAPDAYSFHLANPPQTGAQNLVGSLTLSGTGLLATSPRDGEDGVAVTRETILSFSAPLDPATVTKDVFTAAAPGGPLDFRLHLSADQRQVTLFYTDPLPGNTVVQVSVDGTTLRDAGGAAVNVSDGSLSFSTLSLSMIQGTSVCGRVFASQLAPNGNTSVNEPLQGATITVDGREADLRTVTDNLGNFCLDPSPAGRFFVHIDGRTAGNATPEGGYYPFVGKAWESVAGIESSVGDIYLPLVQPGTLQPVSQTEDVTIGFASSVLAQYPAFADVKITVPAGSLFNDDGTPGERVGIAPVPPDRLPGELPEALDFPLVITVQTGGATNFDTPAPVCFPNLPSPDTGETLAPGEKTALWSFNHDTGRFGVVGPMTANEDASLVCTDPGVGVPAPGWHSWNPGVPTGGGSSRSNDPPPPPPPPEEEEEECEPGQTEKCEPRENYRPSANGCGPEWLPEKDIFGNELYIWDDPLTIASLGSCSLKPACDNHDVGYGTCNADKTQVDTRFRNEMYALCKQCYPSTSLIDLNYYSQCVNYAEAFYRTVDTIGDNFYGPAQDEACECEDCPSRRAGGAALPTWLATVERAALNEDVLTGLTYFMVLNLDTDQIQRGQGGSNGVAFERDIILSPNSRYRIFLLHAETLVEDYMDIVTPGPGSRLELPPFYMPTDLGYDIDEDGLGALGEAVMGTSAFDADSDNDGVLDGAEVQAGGNPTSGTIVQTGIIGTADTPGDAQDVCISGDLAAVADGTAGVALFNVFGGMNPQIVAQINTTGRVYAVACDSTTIVAAVGDDGGNTNGRAGSLVIINAADPTAPLTRTLSFDGSAAHSVAAANGTAYVGLSDGRVVRVDLAAATITDSVKIVPGEGLGLEVHDLILRGDFLHAISEGSIYTLYLESLTTLHTFDLSSSFGDLDPRRRLAAWPQGLLAAQDQNGDILRFDLPPFLQFENYVNATIFGWRHIVYNGSGLAIASTAPAPDSPADQHRIGLYNISDPAEPGFVVEFETPGMPKALTQDSGLVYVADGEAGLQVLNFQATDTAGITPTLTLESNFGPGRFQPGAEMRLTANAQDDVQIRDVAFYLNDELVQTDSSYPFEIRVTAPATTTLLVRAQAMDTGGRFAWSSVQTRTSVVDAVMPELLTIDPQWNGLVAQGDLAVMATFSEAMDPASLTPGSFYLLDEGDQIVAGGAVSYDGASNTATLTIDPAPPSGSYQAVLTQSVTDAAGNPLPRRSWRFQVAQTESGSFITFSDNPGSFLSAIDMDGDWMVVGAQGATVNGNGGQGAAYLFTRDASTASGWREVTKLTGSDGASNDEFGRAVSISGDTVVVGAPNKDLASRNMGQVYVFERNQGGADSWGEVARFADAVGRSRAFGLEVEIQGNTFVAVPTSVLKTAYVYTRTAAGATDWTLAKEVPIDDPSSRNFGAGEAIALTPDEQTLISSIPRRHLDTNELNEGAVRIFERSEGGENNWGQTGQIVASDPKEDAYFGGDLTLTGDVLVVGATFYDQTENDEDRSTGKIYVFRRDANDPQGWRQVDSIDEPETLSPVRTLGGLLDAATDVFVTTGGNESDIYVYRPVDGNRDDWERVLLWQAQSEPAASFFNGIVAVGDAPNGGSTLVTTATLDGTNEPVLFILPLAP